MATLLHRWKLDEGSGQYTYDSIGGLTATVYDTTPGDLGVVWTANGKNGSALSASYELNKYGAKSTTKARTSQPGSFSFGAWLKYQGTHVASTAFTLSPNAEQYAPGLYFYLRPLLGDYIQFMWRRNTNNNESLFATIDSAPSIYADNEWHHYMATGSPTQNEMRLYVDCELKDTAAYEIVTNDGNDMFFKIGGGYSTPSAGPYSWAGDIDDVRLYDDALTEAEICAVMADFDAARRCKQFIFSGGIA